MSENKKKKNDYFSFLNKKTAKSEKNFIFDENYFDFSLSAEGYQTGPIVAEGKVRESGEKIGLVCTWFMIAPDNDIIKLEQVSESVYQPSVEDIGFKFMVQAEPFLEGRQYEGMPKSQEVGPLEMDPQVQDRLTEILEKDSFAIPLTLEKVLKSTEERLPEVPSQHDLVITLHDLHYAELTRKLQPHYPSCQSIRTSSNAFVLNLDDDNSLQLTAPNNADRDIVLLAIKSFYGKGLC